MSARADVDELLRRLSASPDEAALREQAARALMRAGRGREAVELLRHGLINLTVHEPSALPCLCAGCIAQAPATASMGGATFVLDFVVARGRVLYFWLPEELLPDASKVRRSVASSLDERLSPAGKARRRERAGAPGGEQ